MRLLSVAFVVVIILFFPLPFVSREIGNEELKHRQRECLDYKATYRFHDDDKHDKNQCVDHSLPI